MLDHKRQAYVISILSGLLLILMAYGLERYQTVPLHTAYFTLFAGYAYFILKLLPGAARNLNFWLIVALLYRALLLFSMPALSDDFYRFIWDGRVIAAGFNPFTHVPSYYMEMPVTGLDLPLFEKLNSQERFSSYPPVCQLIFWLSAVMSPSSIFGSVLAMRSILLAFEVGTIWILAKLLGEFKLPRTSVLVYALNPLVILEITGNLHFEGVMIFFLMLAIWLLRKNWFWSSCLAFSLAVCTKLIPLIFLPALPRFVGWRKAIMYWLLVGLITIIFFVPLLTAGIVHGFSTSLGYYFQQFEFNASIYYIIREIGFAIAGFNIIQYAGPLLAVTAAGAIFYVALRHTRWHGRRITPDIFTVMLFCLFIYFLSTTILHPWYIITLLSLTIFTRYRFPIVWTGLIFVTYAGYTQDGFHERYFFVACEYAILFAFLLYETIWKKNVASYS